MPSIELPSRLTTRAPICSARICPESRSAVSCGGTVFTTDPLMRKMSATFMAGSIVREVSKPSVYQELCSHDAARHFNFVARGNYARGEGNPVQTRRTPANTGKSLASKLPPGSRFRVAPQTETLATWLWYAIVRVLPGEHGRSYSEEPCG